MYTKFPPHNQRRLNVKIAEVYGGQYADWYDLANSLRFAGGTYEDIRERFAALGIQVSTYTIHSWLKSREREQADPDEAAA